MNIRNTLQTTLLIALFGFIACTKESPQGSLTLVVTANVRAQLDPCG